MSAEAKPKTVKKMLTPEGAVIVVGKHTILIPAQLFRQVDEVTFKPKAKGVEISPSLNLDVPAVIMLAGKGKEIVGANGMSIDCTCTPKMAFGYTKELKSYKLI